MYKILLCFMLFIGVGFSAAAQNPQKGDYVQFEKKFDCGPLCSTPLFVIEGYVTYYHDGFLTIKVSAVLPTSGQTYTERDWEIAHRIVIGEELSNAYSKYYNLKILKEGAFHDQYEQEEEREKAERDRAREAWMKSLREERAALLKDIDVKTKAWSDTYNKPYVDLGLPSGTLWATVNVGARKPWETGNRYAWGETSPKSEYTASSYRYAKGHQERALLGNVTVYEPTKYNGNDKKIRLDLSDDAAYVNMGSEWCTPTQEQVNELYAYCILTSTTNYHGTGISGTLICRKDNLSVHIFIPDGDYWFNQITSYKDLSILTCSYGDNTFSNTASGNSNARYVGNYVRAVKRSKQDLEAEHALQAKINNQGLNFIDLGLPSGTLWACCNVGSHNFGDSGVKFALEKYRIRNTEWRNEDPVKTYLGKDWRMPTKAEYDELMQYCTKHGYSDGLVFKSKINGQTIGFPCDASGKGYYWSSTLIDDRNMYSGELIDSYSAYRLEFDINIENVGVVKGLTSTGCYVRGVLVNKTTANLIIDATQKKWDNLKAQGKPYENVLLLRGEYEKYLAEAAKASAKAKEEAAAKRLFESPVVICDRVINEAYTLAKNNRITNAQQKLDSAIQKFYTYPVLVTTLCRTKAKIYEGILTPAIIKFQQEMKASDSLAKAAFRNRSNAVEAAHINQEKDTMLARANKTLKDCFVIVDALISSYNKGVPHDQNNSLGYELGSAYRAKAVCYTAKKTLITLSGDNDADKTNECDAETKKCIQKAVEAYEKVLSSFPNRIDVLKELRSIYSSLGNTERLNEIKAKLESMGINN